MSAVACRVLPEAEFDAWDQFVAASPDGSPYATARYLDILCEATGGSFQILGVEKSGELVGGIPLYQERELGQPVITPRLLLFYSGLVTRNYDTKYPSEKTSRYLQFAGALETHLRRLPVGLVRLKSRSTVCDVRLFVDRGWRVSLSYSYVVPLGAREAMLGRIEQNLRRLVTRAEKNGLTFAEDGDFDAFYRLHREVHDRKGAKLYLPEAPFRRFVERLRTAGIGRLYHARLATGETAAAQLVLAGKHPVAHVISAASDGAHQTTGANPFLRWKGFEALAADGYLGCDLTDAALNEVTRFKSQLGGDLGAAYLLESPPSPAYSRQRQAALVRRSLGGFARRLIGRGSA